VAADPKAREHSVKDSAAGVGDIFAGDIPVNDIREASDT
jgi:hypothetical protein